jgi:hypothetical protein
MILIFDCPFIEITADVMMGASEIKTLHLIITNLYV